MASFKEKTVAMQTLVQKGIITPEEYLNIMLLLDESEEAKNFESTYAKERKPNKKLKTVTVICTLLSALLLIGSLIVFAITLKFIIKVM